MKSGVAVLLRVAHLVGTGALDPRVDLTWVFYDCEEVEAARNGLGRLARERPDALAGDLAVLLEPTDGVVEGGCQGTLRVAVAACRACARTAPAPGWATNAIHAAAPVLDAAGGLPGARGRRRRAAPTARGSTRSRISGGVAGNVVPDECTVTVNFRFAPDRSEDEALAHVRRGLRRLRRRRSPTRRPAPVPASTRRARRRRSSPPSAAQPRAKLGWTDVARFGELGIPARELRPGRPEPRAQAARSTSRSRASRDAEAALVRFLAAPTTRPSAAARATSDAQGMTQPEPASPEPAGRAPARAGAAAPRTRSAPAPPTSGCSTRAARPTGCTPIRGGCCASSASSSRASGCSPSCPRRSRCSARRARRPTSRVRGRRARSAPRWREAGYAVITGGGPGVDGGGQPRRVRGRRRVGRARHRAAVRAAAQRLGRHRHQLPLLLRPQDDVRQVRAGVRDHARRLRHARRDCSRRSPWCRPARSPGSR